MADNDDRRVLTPPELAPAPRTLIVSAPYYGAIADQLEAGARAALDAAGATAETIEVPGALEIPAAIRLAADSRHYDGFIALGCVVRGETSHYDLVCNESARGLTLLGVERGLPIGNGVLTVEDMAQAQVRADPHGQDKGGDAARACLHLIALARRFGGRPSSFRPDDEQILMA